LQSEEKRPVLPLAIAVILFTALIILISFLREEAGQISSEGFSANYLGFLFLINGNIILVMVLGFLVIKNVVKLVLDRNRGILGAKLRTRLVVAFVGLALVPTILLFLISRGIISSVFQYWFSPQVTTAVDGALAIAKYQYETFEKKSLEHTEIFAGRLAKLLPRLLDVNTTAAGKDALSAEVEEGREILRKLFRAKSEEIGFKELSLYRLDGQLVVSFLDSSLGELEFAPNLNQLRSAALGKASVRLERAPKTELVRAYVPVNGERGIIYVLVTSSAESGELGALLSQVLDSYEDYRELKTYRIPLTSSYILTLVVVSLLLLFAAVWVGFFLARNIVGPIQLLAEGTQQIARGNLSHRIPDVGQDELRMLVDSFNQMTSDLSRTTGELEERRHYIETILQSVGVGVISLDREMRITTFNGAAVKMLGVSGAVIGKRLEEIGAGETAELVKGMLEEQSSEELKTSNLSLVKAGRSRHLQVTVTSLKSEEAGGAVVLLDDLTELVQAQRTAAWQEVARRMAHEIKNPLTPIQLSAQRIERRISSLGSIVPQEEQAVVVESTQTITRAVESLRNLVSEFSRFSRLPKARPELFDISNIAQQVVATFRESHPKVKFDISAVQVIIRADREQIEAVFTNLIENAVQALARLDPQPSSSAVSINISRSEEWASVSIADNGIGVLDGDKGKLFEPYFSTRKGGTGLGLAIVSSILSDHGGKIAVKDNYPCGAIFEFDLPLPLANS